MRHFYRSFLRRCTTCTKSICREQRGPLLLACGQPGVTGRPVPGPAVEVSQNRPDVVSLNPWWREKKSKSILFRSFRTKL